MNSQIERVIALAEADIGYKESPPNSNRTKYGEWYTEPGTKQGALNGQPWCLMAIQYWFNKAGLNDLLLTTAGCTTLMRFALHAGNFHTHNFRRGDLALFSWSGNALKADHVGLITDVRQYGVETIEGNTAIGNDSNGGEVMRRERTNNTIIGVYRPEYEEDDKMTYEDFKQFMARYRAEESAKGATLEEFPSAVTLGITDGTRPRDFATREETAVMVSRMVTANGEDYAGD